MKFGLFYELQLPRPWSPNDEQRLFAETLEQVVLADELGIDYAWQAEHHFLEELSLSSSPEVFLAAAAARTKNIRLGQGIRPVIPNYNHPARTAETIGTLDILSGGRVDFGIGEGATRLELGGFNVPAKEKRSMSFDSAEQIANMMVLEPYPGYDGPYFSMPCRNVVPKPLQKPHPPMWMACTSRESIKVAASKGLGALAFSFATAEEAKTWSDIYYDVIRSEACVPLGHTVNANIALVSSFSLHEDRDEAVRRGSKHFEFFAYAMRALVAADYAPGRMNLWADFEEIRRHEPPRHVAATGGIGSPDDLRSHLRSFEEAGIDQIIFAQQLGRMEHEHICHSLQLFAAEVMPEFKAREAEKAKRKSAELEPWISMALERKAWMRPLGEDERHVVRAAVAKPAIPKGTGEMAVDKSVDADVSDHAPKTSRRPVAPVLVASAEAAGAARGQAVFDAAVMSVEVAAAAELSLDGDVVAASTVDAWEKSEEAAFPPAPPSSPAARSRRTPPR